MAAQEKSEPATPRRRGEARSKGQVARSSELTPAVMLLVAVWLLSVLGADMGGRVALMAQQVFTDVAIPDMTVAEMHSRGVAMMWLIAQLVAPLIAVFVLVGVLGNLIQVGPLFTLKPLAPQLSRLSPINGFRRIFSPNALVDLLRTVVKVTIIGTVAGVTIFGRWSDLAAMTDMATATALQLIVATALEVATKVGWGLLILALLDIFYQRWRFERNLRMSKEEVKEELKQVEGDPLVRSRLRQRQRALARQRMMEAVPEAAVVVTNPVHLAVALQYDPSSPAPKVVAKGQRLVAEQIKDIARQHDVPIIENKPLAQTLFKTVEIGMFVPPELFKAVAELLAMVFRLSPSQAPQEYQGAAASGTTQAQPAGPGGPAPVLGMDGAAPA